MIFRDHIQSVELKSSEANGLLSVLTNYTHSFILLNQYDTGNFPKNELNTHITYIIEHSTALKAIEDLKKRLIEEQQATELFGRQKDNSFEALLGNIIQSFG